MGVKSFSILALAGFSLVEATASPHGYPGKPTDGNCPAVWNQISSEMTPVFLGNNGQCTDLARAAIRFAFHDSGPFSSTLPTYWPASGGADGSLLLNPDEILRPENIVMKPYHEWLSGVYSKYKDQVSAADLIQFAASHATVSCPGGPRVKTVIGREDTSAPAPERQLPPGFGPGASHDAIFKLFQDKGFSAFDLAALIGAHTASKAFNQVENGIPVGAPQDSTPGKWDVTYYAQTYNAPPGVSRFESDINLSNKSTAVGEHFSGFVGNQGKWSGAYVDAMFRLSILGIPTNTSSQFVDCTGALPRGSLQRDVRAAPINDRIR